MVNLDRIPRDKVGLGSIVTVRQEDTGEETVFEIVVPEDSDPTIGRISPRRRSASASSATRRATRSR